MHPAFLIRAGIDWVRHRPDLKDSNPYSRCEETLKAVQTLWMQQVGRAEPTLLEQAIVTSYWAEFFHATDSSPDEREWRDGLNKRSSQYDSFDEWQQWFKKSYAKVYRENAIWLSVLMTSYAYTHQFDVLYGEETWEFIPSQSYLPTVEMWRLEPHMETLQGVLREFWHEELRTYEEAGFTVDESTSTNLGRVESLGFDTKFYTLNFPPRAQREKVILEVGDLVADIIVPTGDDWYRHPDNIIFAHNCLDVTALINRAQYVFGSRRRLLELTIDNEPDKAREQASAEGWLVPELENAIG
ncbi:MAG: hypothetical protein IAF58_21065 [Leptolyngbya sp.]|nr:hypothetical protein [Candidatus Melainabacteria bacterium]